MPVSFLGHSDPGGVVAWRAGRLVKVGQFLTHVRHLSESLPAAPYLVNACADRYCFAVALAAALSRRQVTLLPPDLAPDTLRQLRAEYPELYVVCDSRLGFEGIECLRFQPQEDAAGGAAPNPAFAPDQPAAIVFTSGSTGKPMPHRKTWGALARGAIAEARTLGLLEGPPAALVGTVPPQHMYGLESTVLLPLRNGFGLHAVRPFYPADVCAALEELPAERVLVTTPVHLRALLEDDVNLPRLRLAVCATAPLTAELAARFEDRYEVELREVYGFTEAGMVATRRTVRGPVWQLLPDLRLRRRQESVWVSGGHVPTEVPFSDVIEMRDEVSFVLLGRGADLVNIAGKRTSLAFLNHQLNSIPGVRDGAFFVPEEQAGGVVRPMAFVVAPGLEREGLLEQLRRRIDAVFLPRPLHMVDSLPRNAAGKLPREALIALAASGASRSRAAAVEIETSIAADHPALAGHFPGDPVVPGAVLLDELLETVSREFGWPPGPLRVGSAKFRRPVRPGERLQVRLVRTEADGIRFECSVGGQLAMSGTLERGSGV